MTIQKHKTAWNKGISCPKETRDKISKTLQGNIPWNKGKLLSEEHKQNLRKSHEGKKQSPEHIRKRMENFVSWNKGKKGIYSEEYLRKMSEGQKQVAKKRIEQNGQHWNKGRVHSEEQNKNHSLKLIGIPQTEESNIKRSLALKGTKNHMYGKAPSKASARGIPANCYSPYQGEIRVRSSFELAYAEYLNSINEPWFYELETFYFDDFTYTPDFFLPRQEKFIEIKGYMSDASKVKVERFQEEYPFDLQILYKNDLIRLGIKL